MEVKQLNEKDFNEFINSNEAVLVDFWAPWCGPCKMLGPVLEKLAEEDFIAVGKVNVDEEDTLAYNYGIQSIPCIMIFKNGKLINKAVGYQPENLIKKFIENNR